MNGAPAQMSARSQAISLYRQFMRHGKKFSNYNFKEYVIRRVRDDFRENKAIVSMNPGQMAELNARGKEDLEIVKRQAALSTMFRPDKEYVITQHIRNMQ